MTPQLTIMRIYNCGDRVTQTLDRDAALREIEYSTRFRPGCALFIEAACVQTGYLTPERCAAISEEIKAVKAANTPP